MSDEQTPRPRRSAPSEPPPELPSGWRTSRRNSKAARKARKDIKRYERKEAVSTVARRTKRTVRDILYLAGMAIGGVLATVVVLYLLALAINGVVRWNALRIVDSPTSQEEQAQQVRQNLLLIAVDGDEATGFLAMRNDSDAGRIYGIAFPEAAFIEVPGQGFERIGDSYAVGPEVSLAAVTNFFTVPFEKYAIVDTEIYQTALTDQSLLRVADSIRETNMSDEELAVWAAAFDETPTEDVALVPLPVKPISVGSQTYFEPQRGEVADLLETWWGVTLSETEQVTRVIVYNGSGVPGIAGVAAQELIRGGLRVVDTKNADTFDYETTQIVVQNGDESRADGITAILGVGEVTVQPADQQVADVIIIIGSDYEPDEDVP